MNILKTAGATLLILSISDVNAAAHHNNSASRKMGRGFAAITCGVMEIPGNILRETEMQGVAGIPLGLALGLGKTVRRELVGVYEFISAPFPYPENFKPILSPEFPWGYFD
jgi:putative exosortase-associated protein (TIGR04073 family)